MTEPAPTPRFYAPTEPDPEKGLSPAVRKVRRELMKHPAPLTAAAIEIERLHKVMVKEAVEIERLKDDLTMARADWRNTLAERDHWKDRAEAAEGALADEEDARKHPEWHRGLGGEEP